MRIIAGERRGARLLAPKGADTRPTGDRVREAAFALVGPVAGARVIDLFAGSGAMGLEALSRGAEECVLVESDRDACAVIVQNVAKLRLPGARLVCRDAFEVLRREHEARRLYDLVVLDPPYRAWGELETELAALVPVVLSGSGIVVVETAARTEPQLPLNVVTSRRYGAARITLFTP